MKSSHRSPNSTQRIVECLGIAIVTGQYGAAAFPTEKSLCEKYDAARTITREAVKMLTSKGLIVSRQRRGITVTPEDQWNLFDPDVIRWLLERKPSLELLTEVTQLRQGIEPMAAFLAAQKATPGEREEIAKSLTRMMAAVDGCDDLINSELSFHKAVLHASGNRFCRQFDDVIETGLRLSIRLNGVRPSNVFDHTQVANAILARDSVGAESAMRTAIQASLDLSLASLGGSPTVRSLEPITRQSMDR